MSFNLFIFTIFFFACVEVYKGTQIQRKYTMKLHGPITYHSLSFLFHPVSTGFLFEYFKASHSYFISLLINNSVYFPKKDFKKHNTIATLKKLTIIT